MAHGHEWRCCGTIRSRFGELNCFGEQQCWVLSRANRCNKFALTQQIFEAPSVVMFQLCDEVASSEQMQAISMKSRLVKRVIDVEEVFTHGNPLGL
jgi:hypothetical protein